MSVTNAEIKMIRSLAVKKYREESGLFVVEGEKMVAEALSSGLEVLKVVRAEEVGTETMARISSLNSPSPVLAVLKRPAAEKFAVPSGGLCLGLDAVRDPGNLGTILRIADWFGVSAVYASSDTVEAYNPKVIQASMGSIFRTKIVYCDISEVCDAFKKAGRQVFGTFLEGRDIYGTDLPADALVIMGNEANGISEETAGRVTARLTIPSFGKSGAESLNVAVATAITLSEFRRRQ